MNDWYTKTVHCINKNTIITCTALQDMIDVCVRSDYSKSLQSYSLLW